jgi:hypothetical protein
MSKMSRRIVVDASVARAAGTTENPISTRSREFLQAMLRICHQVVMTPEIAREWRRNQSVFSATWLAAMRRRRKVVEVLVAPAQQEALLELILGSDLGVKQKAAAEKDCLLVGAAWASDDVVASNDDTVRRLLSRLVEQSADLRRICWVNPTRSAETTTEWLEAGARTDSHRRLGAGQVGESEKRD